MGLTGKKVEKETMQTSFHKGFVLLSAVALIFFVAALFFSLAPQFLYVKKKAQHSTDQIVEVIETENTRIRNKYDLY